jgi:hypothetical protein
LGFLRVLGLLCSGLLCTGQLRGAIEFTRLLLS